jgi:hypothetical protein
MPKEDFFLPIQGGKAISKIDLGIQGDDTGENISEKNFAFNETTVMYWAWKNIKKMYPNLEYIGLAHYRRYFAMDDFYTACFDRRSDVVISKLPVMKSYDNIILSTLKTNDIILKRYSLDNILNDQYYIYHHSCDYHILKKIIKEMRIDYYDSFLRYFENNNEFIACNLFVAKYELFENYCQWLFPILFELEKRIDISNRTLHQKRAVSFLADRLFGLYMYRNKFKVAYKPVFFIQENNEYSIKEWRLLRLSRKQKLKKFIKKIIPYGIIELLSNRRKRR